MDCDSFILNYDNSTDDKTIRSKDTSGVSLLLFIIYLIANIVALVYAFMISQTPLIIKYIIAIFTTVIYLGLYFYYLNRKVYKSSKLPLFMASERCSKLLGIAKTHVGKDLTLEQVQEQAREAGYKFHSLSFNFRAKRWGVPGKRVEDGGIPLYRLKETTKGITHG